MELKFLKGDLFEADEDYFLAHCISADFALGAGIAKTFNENFDMRARLRQAYGGMEREKLVGRALMIGRVFNLVSKERYFNKPTYKSLQSCLEDMRRIMEENSITKLAMPKIGCGLDRLKWEKVESLLKETFEGTNTEILVYSLDQ
ncbi:MAG: macro domain-containing protein [Oscillospiraceae bacterium]|nr:macro domain-containing protein [Oscillospiraceae bacterium]